MAICQLAVEAQVGVACDSGLASSLFLSWGFLVSLVGRWGGGNGVHIGRPRCIININTLGEHTETLQGTYIPCAFLGARYDS